MKNNRCLGKYKVWTGIFVFAILVMASCLPVAEQAAEDKGAAKIIPPSDLRPGSMTESAATIAPQDSSIDTTVYPPVDPHMILYKEAFRRYMNRYPDSSSLP